MDYQVVSVLPQDKKKVKVCLDNGVTFALYKGEVGKLSLFENKILTETEYQQIIEDILGKRAIKRAMYLLERQQRTEKQLREKLQQNGYPLECIERALDYVKYYGYVDDYQYASAYVRYHQAKESRQKLAQKLIGKGIERELIEQILQEEFETDERALILELLRKKKFDSETADKTMRRKIVQFLMRKGFKLRDILAAMRLEVEEI